MIQGGIERKLITFFGSIKTWMPITGSAVAET
jgi:hypothetical protein